jgi:hypothetical protein
MLAILRAIRPIAFLPLSLSLYIISKLISNLKGLTIRTVIFDYSYFGHSAIEPAIVSAVLSRQPHLLFAAHTFLDTPCNEFLANISLSLFPRLPTLPIRIIESIYNNSHPRIKLKISRFYEPIFPRRIDREMYYWPLLSSSHTFAWRTKVRSSLNLADPQTHQHPPTVLVALRTDHFHKKSVGVNPQLYRNITPDEHVYLLSSFLQGNSSIRIIVYTSPSLITLLRSSLYEHISRIEFVDQNLTDILHVLPKATLLVSNANGIGAFAFAANIPTLYVKHSPYHVWFTSHSHSFVIPPLYISNNAKLSWKCSLQLGFSPDSLLPFDYSSYFADKSISLVPLTEYPSLIFSETLNEMISFIFSSSPQQDLFNPYPDSTTHPDLHTEFWSCFFSFSPYSIHRWHTNVNLRISTSFLQSF